MTNTTIQTTVPRVLTRRDARRADFPDPALPTIDVRVDAADRAGFSLLEYAVPAGFTPPPTLHRHTQEGAVLYLLEGELHYWFEDGDHRVGPGDVVHLPAGAWFRWANESDHPARMLAMFSPAGFEEFFVDLVAATTTSGGDRVALGRVIGQLRAAYGDEDHPGQA
ncbi:cupin domain-containing protein [Nocardioides guangzhouensis]|uniref:Cupin domain-containing protein n=1 Tax=Nocardioides guangzhouensis TaxID=2497878 RepID=A0A4Q4ZCE9_9ACTN|nr:cupin domain-containing protein [Nocardioides guangzhouensis]RYP85265.1 cupin domain-containing protein [Nocardioides guangzhouensis]